MQISEIELHEFRYRLDDVGKRSDGLAVYDPGSRLEPRGFILTIRTTDGEEGHYRGHLRAIAQMSQIKLLANQYVLGRNPLERESIWQDLWRGIRHTGRLGIGPIDIALWDLAGKYYGEPVYALLGGGHKSEIPAYASTVSGNPETETPDTYAKFAETCLDLGYGGFKIHPFGDPNRDIEICRAVADRVGDDMDLMLDPSSCYKTLLDAISVGQALDDLGFFWYEDPTPDTGESITAMRRLATELKTPILGLEHSRTEPFGALNHLINDALDIIRVDAHFGGGLTGALKVAHAAEAAGFDVEPHIGGPAHLHLLSTIRNTHYFEHGLVHPDLGFDWLNHQAYEEPVEVVSDGTVTVPDDPGLGVSIDWDFVMDRLESHVVYDEMGAETSYDL